MFLMQIFHRFFTLNILWICSGNSSDLISNIQHLAVLAIIFSQQIPRNEDQLDRGDSIENKNNLKQCEVNRTLNRPVRTNIQKNVW